MRELARDTTRWDAASAGGSHDHDILVEVLNDCSTFLSSELYRDAIIELVTNKLSSPCSVEIMQGSYIVGRQPMHLVCPKTALVVSASAMPDGFEAHLQRLLNHTALKNMFWINMNKHDIVCANLRNKAV